MLPLQTDYTNESGVILDASKFRFKEALVVTSGLDDIKEGGKVLYDTVNSHDSMIGGKKFRIILAKDIAVIL